MAAFVPDSPVVLRVVPSPNHSERKSAIDMIVLHYTGMTSGEEALARLTDPASHVSSHYLVDEEGRIDQLMLMGQRAGRPVFLEGRYRQKLVLDRHRNCNTGRRLRLPCFPRRADRCRDRAVPRH